MRFASTERVMFQMLYFTGCRLTCLDRMYIENLLGEYIYWQPGKKQRKPRKERLPVDYLNELRIYRETHKVDHRLFAVTGETFRGYFKNFLRPKLPKSWQKKRPILTATGFRLEYVYQIKGLRKNFQTLDLKRNVEEYGSVDLAIEKTSARMSHSSYKITARHYIENFDALGIKKLSTLDPAALLKVRNQKRIWDYM